MRHGCGHVKEGPFIKGWHEFLTQPGKGVAQGCGRSRASHAIGKPGCKVRESEPDHRTKKGDSGRYGEKKELVVQTPPEQLRIQPFKDIEESQQAADKQANKEDVPYITFFRAEGEPVLRENNNHKGHHHEVLHPAPITHHSQGKLFFEHLSNTQVDEQKAKPPCKKNPDKDPCEDHGGGSQESKKAGGAEPLFFGKEEMCEWWDDDKSHDNGRDEREGLGEGQGLEQFALRSFHGEYRQKTHNGGGYSGQDGASHFSSGLVNDLELTRFRRSFLQTAQDVFTDNDAHVHDSAYGNGDTGEGHNVRIHPKESHGDKAHEHGKGKEP